LLNALMASKLHQWRSGATSAREPSNQRPGCRSRQTAPGGRLAAETDPSLRSDGRTRVSDGLGTFAHEGPDTQRHRVKSPAS